MRKTLKAIFSILLLLPALAFSNGLPSAESMSQLSPTPGTRLRLYDRLFRTTALMAEENHRHYTDPAVLADVEARLERVRASGNPEDVFSDEERQQLEKNLVELRRLEGSFFDRWYLKIPMSAAIKFQSWLTRRNSQAPTGAAQADLIAHFRASVEKNVLYKNWFQELPENYRQGGSAQTWGEVLVQFSSDEAFRQQWIQNHPETLPQLKQFSEVWAWEDSSVRNVRVYNAGTALEHWVLERAARPGVPNRFETILKSDYEGLLRIEYAPSLYFNRLSKVSTDNNILVYQLEAVEKGRTMEPALVTNENGTDKVTFKGAELLRKTKADEFLQRDYIKRGSLNLFLGLRTMQLNQIQALMKIHPELTLAVGQMGFSVTGGMAQTVSNRTDSPQEQLLKMTATLIDFIEFAQTKDVPAWFQRNTRHVLRTVVGGVGSGGSKALAEPTSKGAPRLVPKAQGLSCQGVFL